MSVWIGKTLGKVQIEKPLGRGGMAEVYLGTHISLQRPVAVKILHGYLEKQSDIRKRFEREARIAASLRHPNIVQVFDYDAYEDSPFIVMEYVSGSSLAAYLQSIHNSGGELPLDITCRIIPMLADALDYAHQQGVIHRDVKPGNVLLHSRTGKIEAGQPLPKDVEPLLADFGLVRILDSPTQTTGGWITGTPSYMSPEQARGERVDHRGDIYSLGALLYELLSGRVPFEGDTAPEVLQKVLYESQPAIPDIPWQWQSVLDRALEKDPDRRYQSAGELSRAFLAAVDGTSETDTNLPVQGMKTPPERASTSRPPNSGPIHPTPTKPRRIGRWPLVLVLVIAAGTLWAARSLLFAPPTNPPSTGEPFAIDSSTAAETLSSNAAQSDAEGSSIGVLRFRDVEGVLDGVTVSVHKMPPPNNGSQYEVWLVTDDGTGLLSVGKLLLDQDGAATLDFVDRQHRNLLEGFSRMQISLEPLSDPNPSSPGKIVYSSGIPKDALEHIRHLLVSFPSAPEETSLVQGLKKNISMVDQQIDAMIASFEAGDEANMRADAEAALNLIAGNQSTEWHNDWNEDGVVVDPGDGFGLLLNGDNPGYGDGVLIHTDLAMRANDAPADLILHGGRVKISIQNMEIWANQLRDLLAAISRSPFDESLREPIWQAGEIAGQLLNGIDLNGDDEVSPILGEAGVLTAYEHAYYMADMIILFGQDRVMPPAPTVTPAFNRNNPISPTSTTSPTSSANALTPTSPPATLPLPTLPPPTIPLPTLPPPTLPIPTQPIPTLPLPVNSASPPSSNIPTQALFASILIGWTMRKAVFSKK